MDGVQTPAPLALDAVARPTAFAPPLAVAPPPGGAASTPATSCPPGNATPADMDGVQTPAPLAVDAVARPTAFAPPLAVAPPPCGAAGKPTVSRPHGKATAADMDGVQTLAPLAADIAARLPAPSLSGAAADDTTPSPPASEIAASTDSMDGIIATAPDGEVTMGGYGTLRPPRTNGAGDATYATSTPPPPTNAASTDAMAGFIATQIGGKDDAARARPDRPAWPHGSTEPMGWDGVWLNKTGPAATMTTARPETPTTPRPGIPGWSVADGERLEGGGGRGRDAATIMDADHHTGRGKSIFTSVTNYTSGARSANGMRGDAAANNVGEKAGLPAKINLAGGEANVLRTDTQTAAGVAAAPSRGSAQQRAEPPALLGGASSPPTARGKAGLWELEAPLTWGASPAASTAPREGLHAPWDPQASLVGTMGECNPSNLPAPYFAEVGKLREVVDQLCADKVALQETLAKLLEQVADLREALLGRGAVETTNPPPVALEPPQEGPSNAGGPLIGGGTGVGGRSVDLNATQAPLLQGPNEWSTVVKKGKGKGKANGSGENTTRSEAGKSTPPERKPASVIEKVAAQALSEPPAPAEFESVFFTLRDPRAILSAEPKERPRIIRAIIRKLELQRYISGVSVLPGPIVQIIAMKGSIRHIRETLVGQGLALKPDTDRLARPPRSTQSEAVAMAMTARRLASLCRQSKSRNFQEEALKGTTDILRALVLKEYRRMTNNPHTLLGHRGRPYSDQHMAVDSEGGTSSN